MAADWLTLREVAERLDIALNTLRRMLDESPTDLPGRPVEIGHGARRAHVRWLPGDLQVWLGAYAQWRRGEWKPPVRRTGRFGKRAA